MQGEEAGQGKEGKSQRAVLLYGVILLGLRFAVNTLNLEENGSRKQRCLSAVFICSNLKVAIS